MARKVDSEATKANFVLHGSSWTVAHLDRFLQSEWGQRLFKPPAAASPSSPLRRTTEAQIRPSPAFLAVPRDTPLVINPSLSRRPASAAASRRYVPDLDQVETLTRGMTAASGRRQELAGEARSLMSAKARFKLAEAEKKQEKDFAAFKSQRAMITKQQRLLANLPQSGISGLQSAPNRPFSARPTNPQLQSSIAFGWSSPSPVTRSQLKRFPDREHNTFHTLFHPASQPVTNPQKECSLQLRYSRPFNIVTGTSY